MIIIMTCFVGIVIRFLANVILLVIKYEKKGVCLCVFVVVVKKEQRKMNESEDK